MSSRPAQAAEVSQPLIHLEDLHRSYTMGSSVVHALDGVRLDVCRNEYLAIMGSSGSGKSTLMNIIGCLDRPTSGEYWLGADPISRMNDRQLARLRNERIGFVFQTFHLLPRMTAIANVEVPLIYAGMKRRERQQKAFEVLNTVGLGDRLTHRPSEMSGGERQRVAVARALVTGPSILLADEPTGNLDSVTGDGIMKLFDELHAAGNTLIVVTHEQDVADHAQRIVRLSDGKIVADNMKEVST